ncbi:uncharacterized protein BDV14DRAFT_183163 [Aspergillus stella-maris]|uniref:uncharacterized protein n=1 Tax=Aspergillus stella-maris TaxID=1810926 RepID=UPI003CCDC52F
MPPSLMYLRLTIAIVCGLYPVDQPVAHQASRHELSFYCASHRDGTTARLAYQ